METLPFDHDCLMRRSFLLLSIHYQNNLENFPFLVNRSSWKRNQKMKNISISSHLEETCNQPFPLSCNFRFFLRSISLAMWLPLISLYH